MFHELAHRRYENVKSMRRALRYDGRRDATPRPPPDLGEPTEEVLREFGIAADRLQHLRDQGLI